MRGEIGPVPPELAHYQWRVSVPPAAADRVARAQYVYRDATGALRCPVVERVAAEWETARRVRSSLPPSAVTRLVDTLSYLVPGPPPEGMPEERVPELVSEGVIADDGEWRIDPEATEEARAAANYVLAVVLARGWSRGWTPAAQRRLVAHASAMSMDPIDAKVELCASALLVAAAEEDEPLGARPGKQWGKSSDRPAHDISAASYLRWLWATAIRHARAQLREQEAEPSAGPPSARRTDEHPSPLAALVAAEAATESIRRLAAVEAAATPRQREILRALTAALARGEELAAAKRAAAEELGIVVGTVDVQLSRLRKRV